MILYKIIKYRLKKINKNMHYHSKVWKLKSKIFFNVFENVRNESIYLFFLKE